MVFYFTSSDGHMIYMGKDKYENEDLIKYGLTEDIWFHVDDLSSAHVYLRLNPGEMLDDLSPELIEECTQLVKANSIEGCKLKEVYVVYTRWKNLNKTSSMEIGAIGYHDQKKVRRVKVIKNNAIVNKINRTREERHPDLSVIQQDNQREEIIRNKQLKKMQIENEKNARKEKEEAIKLKSYSSIMKAEKMKTLDKYGSSVDDSAAKAAEDDFM
mmetsp:Transcript_15461/g.13992  ORF Transcript_15461/g.13992 Transcript_15461/m.13992 type:complete len:214 (+) Transcript_15461:19-660(+)